MSAIPIYPSGAPQLVTPSNTATFTYDSKPVKTRGISIGVAGDLAIKDSLGNNVIIPAASLAIGMIHPIETSQIRSTGTTATSIVAWF